MNLLDWSIVAGLLLVLLVSALHTKKYTRSVSAFLAAERCGGRYLISMAKGMAGLGVITLVYWFEVYYEAGFTAYWWGALTEPALILLALSGWVIYRFRQTRALTLPQFFEMRYSRSFRVFAGLVAYLAGIINFGIFPAVGARFFIAICGLPEVFFLGSLEISTFVALMAGLLSISLLFTFLGGQVAVMVTDFVQGMFANVVFAVVIAFLLFTFDWGQISETLLQAPAEKSLVHPFHIGEQDHFNIWFFIISVVVVFYGVMGWQGTQGYEVCAKDAHEAKMAGILNGWRFRVLLIIAIVVPITVRVFLQHPDFSESAASVHQSLDAIQGDTPDQVKTLQNQLRTPLALAMMLPHGLLGLMCAAMLAAFISTHDTYLHSWGSIFVQDVILPFRKKPLTPKQHLRWLRFSILGVGLVIFFFSLLLRHTQFIAMFCAVTASIFVGGAGSVIIGGLYWKRGTTAGAWAAMLMGMVLSLIGIMVRQFEWDIALFGREVLTGQEMTFVAIVAAVTTYVGVSLFGPQSVHNMDKLLHRGKYADPEEAGKPVEQKQTWLTKLGIDPEFTGWDRIVTYFSVGWPLVWTALFTVVVIYQFSLQAGGSELSNDWWLIFWKGFTWTVYIASVVVTIWFFIGGLKDIRFLFAKLRSRPVKLDDDGRVNADRESEPPTP